MKNKEVYAKEITELVINRKEFGVNKKTNSPCACLKLCCDDCIFTKKEDATCLYYKKIKQWAEEEYKEPLLDDVEKRYLKEVIKPFRKIINCIVKRFISQDTGIYDNNSEWICIECNDGFRYCFPPFEAGTMYKGMQRFKKYTLEELGL